jgi:hypothetical protein
MSSNHPANRGSNWNGEMSKTRRTALYLRAGLECGACGRSALAAPKARLSLDHLRAVSLGGDNGDANLVVLCRRCNSSKGAKPLKVWLAAGGHSKLGLCASAAVVERNLRAQAARPLAPYIAPARQIVRARARQLYRRRKARAKAAAA